MKLGAKDKQHGRKHLDLRNQDFPELVSSESENEIEIEEPRVVPYVASLRRRPRFEESKSK
eukprot:6278228-Karenia_brevis.AAC.1